MAAVILARASRGQQRERYTRFILLSPSQTVPEDADKLSLVFRLDHRPRALSLALEPFARRDINLMKIESRPVHGRPWQYRFYLDLQASSRDPEVVAAARRTGKARRRVGEFWAAMLQRKKPTAQTRSYDPSKRNRK